MNDSFNFCKKAIVKHLTQDRKGWDETEQRGTRQGGRGRGRVVGDSRGQGREQPVMRQGTAGDKAGNSQGQGREQPGTRQGTARDKAGNSQ